MNKSELINFLRSEGFNCFPIPAGQKAADGRYRASNTEEGQSIQDSDNYGVLPSSNGTCIIDCDDKERFRDFAQRFIDNGSFVIESPHGWHIYAKNVKGLIKKSELFDYSTTDKKILEIQGPDHYCVGGLSIVDSNQYKVYEGSIWSVNEDFHQLVDNLCSKLRLSGRKKDHPGSYAYLRQRFIDGLPPTKGTSNDYFMQSALVCNTDGLSKDDCHHKIRDIYDKWEKEVTYSGRPWSNVEAKINEVYDNNLTIKHGGNRKGEAEDRSINISKEYMEENKLYSDKRLELVYRTENGFLEEITTPLRYIISNKYMIDENTVNHVMFRIMSDAEDIPETDVDGIRFDNGVFNTQSNSFTPGESDKICLIGYKGKKYIEDAYPPHFINLIEKQIKEGCRHNLYTWLKSVPTAEKQIRMCILYGKPGTGKTALAELLQYSIGDELATASTMADFFKDQVTRSGAIGKVLYYFQDTPKKWSDIDRLKQMTGESRLNFREIYKGSELTRNMLNIVMSTNTLSKIESEDQGPMFDRMTLVTFEDNKIRGSSQDDERFAEHIAKVEGEAIISYCLNLRKDDTIKFDSSESIRSQWDDISIPEKALFNKLFTYKKDSGTMSPIELKTYMEDHSNIEVDMDMIKAVAKKQGFQMISGAYKDIDIRLDNGKMEDFVQ